MKSNRGGMSLSYWTGAMVLAALLPWGSSACAEDACVPDPIGLPLSLCRGINAAALHRTMAACPGRPEPFLVNRRLALIENGTVPCLHVETGEAMTCAFLTRRPPVTSRAPLAGSGRLAAQTAARPGERHDRDDDDGDDRDGDDDSGRGHGDADKCGGGDTKAYYSGNWLTARDGSKYALVGQAVGLDGSRGGEYVIGARLEPASSFSAASTAGTILPGRIVGTVPCIGASGRDADAAMAGTELANGCAIETLNAETNVTCRLLQNVATIPVCTSSFPHPDGAELLSADRETSVYCYKGKGAGLNDVTGTERDEQGLYFPPGPQFKGDEHFADCHTVMSSGVETIAAKRPSTRSFPRHEVLTNTRLRWLPVDPSVTIANP